MERGIRGLQPGQAPLRNCHGRCALGEDSAQGWLGRGEWRGRSPHAGHCTGRGCRTGLGKARASLPAGVRRARGRWSVETAWAGSPGTRAPAEELGLGCSGTGGQRRFCTEVFHPGSSQLPTVGHCTGPSGDTGVGQRGLGWPHRVCSWRERKDSRYLVLSEHSELCKRLSRQL